MPVTHTVKRLITKPFAIAVLIPGVLVSLCPVCAVDDIVLFSVFRSTLASKSKP